MDAGQNTKTKTMKTNKDTNLKKIKVPSGTTHVRLTNEKGQTALETVAAFREAFAGAEGKLAFLSKDKETGRFTELEAVEPKPKKVKSIDRKTAAIVAEVTDQKTGNVLKVKGYTTESVLRAVGTKHPEGIWSVTKTHDDYDAPVDIDATKNAKKQNAKKQNASKAAKKAKASKQGGQHVPTPSKAKKEVEAVEQGKKQTTGTRKPNYVKVDDYILDQVRLNAKSAGSTKSIDEIAADISKKYPRLAKDRAAYWIKFYARKHNIEMPFDVAA